MTLARSSVAPVCRSWGVSAWAIPAPRQWGGVSLLAMFFRCNFCSNHTDFIKVLVSSCLYLDNV